jgi:hypothetical protein
MQAGGGSRLGESFRCEAFAYVGPPTSFQAAELREVRNADGWSNRQSRDPPGRTPRRDSPIHPVLTYVAKGLGMSDTSVTSVRRVRTRSDDLGCFAALTVIAGKSFDPATRIAADYRHWGRVKNCCPRPWPGRRSALAAISESAPPLLRDTGRIPAPTSVLGMARLAGTTHPPPRHCPMSLRRPGKCCSRC